MDYKLVDIADADSLPPPRVLTAEEEAAIIARCKAEVEEDPSRIESELRELLAQYERGELVDAEDLLREIEAGTPPRKPT